MTTLKGKIRFEVPLPGTVVELSTTAVKIQAAVEIFQSSIAAIGGTTEYIPTRRRQPSSPPPPSPTPPPTPSHH